MDAWLEALRTRLPRHAALLDRLLAICRADDRIRVLQLQCSIARGAGDELSDLDLGIAVRDDAWESVARELPERLRALADPVDVHTHTIPEWGTRAHRRIFVQYHDGRQIDLVVQPAGDVSGRVPGAVVLHDPEGRLDADRVVSAGTATAADVHAWERLGWELLASVTKYVQRGSAWEAMARLTGARDLALNLWATAEGVPYPGFGLTSLLDVEPPRLPDRLEATVAGPDLAELASAGRACAELLRRSAARARERVGSADPESPMAAWVSERLPESG